MQRVQGGTKEEFKVWMRHKIEIIMLELLRTSTIIHSLAQQCVKNKGLSYMLFLYVLLCSYVILYMTDTTYKKICS